MQPLQCSVGVVVWWSLHWVLRQGWAGVVCGGVCGFATFWSFSVEEALLANHSKQNPASVCLASPGHVMRHCKSKRSLCSAQQVWWSLYRVLLRQGSAGGLWGLQFCRFLEFFNSGGAAACQPQCTESCQCVSGEP